MLFDENLKRICAAKGTNPTQVCKDLGLSTSKVNAWYNGSLPKQENLLKIARHLGCSVMDFFEDINDTVAKEPELVLDEDENEIIRIFRTLDRRARHEVMAYIYRYEKQTTLQGDGSESEETSSRAIVG